jgi:hypothetical protein
MFIRFGTTIVIGREDPFCSESGDEVFDCAETYSHTRMQPASATEPKSSVFSRILVKTGFQTNAAIIAYAIRTGLL